MSTLVVKTAVDWSLSRHDNSYSPSQTVPVITLTGLTLPRFHLIHDDTQASTRPPEHGNESSSVADQNLASNSLSPREAQPANPSPAM